MIPVNKEKHEDLKAVKINKKNVAKKIRQLHCRLGNLIKGSDLKDCFLRYTS
jgi:hypothetical protein